MLKDKPALIQKVMTAIIVSLVMSAFFLAHELITQMTTTTPNYYGGMFIVVGVYALIGNVIVGIPISLLSDIVTKKTGSYRFTLAGVMHFAAAALTVFLIHWMAFYSMICAALFFLIDEWMKRRKHVKWLPVKRNEILNLLSVSAVFALCFLGVQTIVASEVLEEKTHQTYLIPEGYEGKVRIVHEVKGVPDPKTSGDYTLVEINSLGYGTTPYPMSEGIIEDKYYYVAKDGKKTRIDETCICIGGTEGTQGDGYDYESSVFYVTKQFCSEGFQESGQTYYPEELSLHKVLELEGLVTEDEF